MAPVYSPKPSPQSETNNIINNKHAVILPSHNNHNNSSVSLPQGSVVSQETQPSEVSSGDPSLQDNGEEDVADEVLDLLLHDLAQSVAIWEHSLQSDSGAAMPPPCGCHAAPVGSCPTVKDQLIKNIVLCRSFGVPNMDGARIPLPNPSFNYQVWKEALGSYFDAKEVSDAIIFGWDPSFISPPQPKDALRNNASALQFPKHVLHYVEKEVGFGALVGPFDPSELPFRIFRSPFGSVFKFASEWRRTVTDCTQVFGGINSFIDPRSHRGAPWKLTLPNSATIVRAILRTREKFPNQRVHIWKLDMARWYRWIQLDPVSIPFFAVMWDHKVYLDSCMSFGNRAAALAAQRFIWAVCWIYRTQIPPHPGTFNTGSGCHCQFHCDCGENLADPYIDDVIGVSAQHLSADNFSSFLALAKHLGLRLSTTPGHVSPPGPVCVCLGLEYNVDTNTISFPKAKLEALQDLLRDWLTRKTATEKDLASLAGKLLHACNVFFAGRLFLNRVLATKRRAARVRRSYNLKHIYLEEAFKEDIIWWLEALEHRNGVSFLVHDATVDITLDASSTGWTDGTPGIGAYHHQLNQYISVSPPEHLHDLHISDLELLAHILVARVWGPELHHQHARIWTDNTACFYLIKNGRSSHDRRLKMARIFSFSQIENDYRVEPAWISTTDNWIADALSRPGSAECRLSWEKFAGSLGASPKQRHISPEMFEF